MKSTGMVRQLDILGRIVIPAELRRTMGLCPKESLEIFVEEDQILLRRYHPACVFCNSTEDVVSFKGKLICQRCLTELRGQH